MFNTYNEFKSDSDTYLDVKKARVLRHAVS